MSEYENLIDALGRAVGSQRDAVRRADEAASRGNLAALVVAEQDASDAVKLLEGTTRQLVIHLAGRVKALERRVQELEASR